MRIVVAYKWSCDPEEATVRADGTVDWSRAKPGISTYDPVAMELARRLAEEAGAELIGVSAGGKGVAVPIATKAALSRGLDRVAVVEDESLRDAGRSELAAVLAGAIQHIGDVDLVITGDSSVDVGGQDGADRAGRPAGLARRRRGHRRDRPGRHAASGARDPRRCPGARAVRTRRPRCSADAAVPRVPGMKELARGRQEAGRAAGAQRAEGAAQRRGSDGHRPIAPGPKARKGQVINTADPAAAAAELVTALRAAGAL